jgi:hypothetical protein
MGYEPLEESRLWREAREAVEKTPLTCVCMMRHIESRLLGGDGYFWSGGSLVQGGELKQAADGRYIDTSRAQDLPDPTAHESFSAIPSLSVRRGDSYPATIDPCTANVKPAALHPLTNHSAIARISFDADIHYIAAGLILLKHMIAHPERIGETAGNPRARQMERAGILARACLDMVTQRGLEDDFSKSCAEFAARIPKPTPALVVLNESYVNRQIAQWKQCDDINEALGKSSPEEKAKYLRKALKLNGNSDPEPDFNPFPSFS